MEESKTTACKSEPINLQTIKIEQISITRASGGGMDAARALCLPCLMQPVSKGMVCVCRSLKFVPCSAPDNSETMEGMRSR